MSIQSLIKEVFPDDAISPHIKTDYNIIKGETRLIAFGNYYIPLYNKPLSSSYDPYVLDNPQIVKELSNGNIVLKKIKLGAMVIFTDEVLHGISSIEHYYNKPLLKRKSRSDIIEYSVEKLKNTIRLKYDELRYKLRQCGIQDIKELEVYGRYPRIVIIKGVN